MRSESHGRLGQVAVLAAPVVAIALFRWLAGGPAIAPASQPAQDSSVQPAINGDPIPALTPAQLRAIEWIRGPRAAEIAGSPFDMSLWAASQEPTPVVPTPRPQPVIPSTTLDAVVASLRVSAVLGRAEDALVALNGKVLRVGDEAAPGWKIASINIDDQSVHISDENGTRVLITREGAAISR